MLNVHDHSDPAPSNNEAWQLISVFATVGDQGTVVRI